MSKMLQVGDKAPTFSLPDQDGNMVDIASIMGTKAMILYFYPKGTRPTSSSAKKTRASRACRQPRRDTAPATRRDEARDATHSALSDRRSTVRKLR